MEIDTKQATEFGFLILFMLMFVVVLNVFYPSDFGIFNSSLLITPLRIDAVTIGGLSVIVGVGAAVGFFTSGSAVQVAVIGIVLAFCLVLYPIFVYLIDIFTLGMFTYPNYQIHQETPIFLLLFIAIPATAVIFYLLFDLVTSALQSGVTGD